VALSAGAALVMTMLLVHAFGARPLFDLVPGTFCAEALTIARSTGWPSLSTRPSIAPGAR
jgi:hypothetical protein